MLPGGGTRLRPARPGGRAELPAGGPQPAHQPAHQPGPGHSVTSLISRQSQEGGPPPPTGGRSDGHLTRVGSGGQPDRRESGGNYWNSNFYNGDNQNISQREREGGREGWAVTSLCNVYAGSVGKIPTYINNTPR